MTKQEILDTGESSDYDLFQSFNEEYRNRIRSLGMALASSVWHTRLLSGYQIRRLRKLSEELEKCYQEMLGWNFHGKNNQNDLFPLDK